jgi:hypothetical protein
MTTEQFRRLALSLPEVLEQAHHGHPDFRVGGKVFATLGYPGGEWAMVKLTSAQQRQIVKAGPGTFSPVKGGWGSKGATQVHLEAAETAEIRRALITAWKNVAPNALREGFEELTGDDE